MTVICFVRGLSARLIDLGGDPELDKPQPNASSATVDFIVGPPNHEYGSGTACCRSDGQGRLGFRAGHGWSNATIDVRPNASCTAGCYVSMQLATAGSVWVDEVSLLCTGIVRQPA